MHQHAPLLSRRRLLYGSAVLAGSLAVSACSSGGGSGSSSPAGKKGGGKGSPTKPVALPGKLTEAPALAKQVKAGSLPPLSKRLPEKPYVVPHRWIERGQYGGTLNMPVFGTTGMANASSVRQFSYGFSPTRWLNDGLDIGPGLAERWSSNADTTVWTVSFRKGLRWSDGTLFTVEDIIFWYEDIATPGYDAQPIPQDCLSAKGTPCTMAKVDDSTLRITYDAPQPLVPDYLASWPKGGAGKNGPAWILPKHYLKEFHPKYNKSVPKDWDTAGGLWEQKADWMRNPECPTLTGYRCKSFDNNKGVVLERNPYYFAVTADGDQLPYIDEWNITLFQDAQVIKLQVQQGKADYCHGEFNQIDLGDVSTLSKNKDAGNYDVRLWDSGDGTGSMFFLNYDYIAKDEKYGKLFRDKRFRQAISHAYDRPTAQKTLYFQTGEQTTGTSGSKIIEFSDGPDGPKIFQQWRDSYKKHDVAKAKSLLAELGLKDANGDGYVEFPDGSKLVVEIPYSADISDAEAAKDDQLVADAKKVGLRMVRRPVPPQAFPDMWDNGALMSHTNWSVGDGATVLVYPQWLVPLESTRWAPLEGAYYAALGTPKEHQEQNLAPIHRHPPRMAPEKDGAVDKLIKLYNETKLEPDPMKRNQLVWQMMRIHIDEGPFFMGTVANYPRVVIVNKDLANVPTKENFAHGGLDGPWVFPCPGMYDPEAYFWRNPESHT